MISKSYVYVGNGFKVVILFVFANVMIFILSSKQNIALLY